MTTRRRIQPGDGDERHGTTNGYVNHGCRCVPCRAAWAAALGRLRVAAKSVGLTPDDPRHGTTNAYSYWGCRCRPCTVAHSVANRRWESRRRDEVST